jgi:hypothetical protein
VKKNICIPGTCIVQKIQTKGGVYVVEKVYGLEAVTKPVQITDPTATSGDLTSLTMMNGNNIENDTGKLKEEDATEQEPEADTSVECVICLTELRTVALFPCRHFCLCMTCAEALPSQSNKCPICRKPSFLLFDFRKQNAMSK